MRSYRPEELFDDDGAARPELRRARARGRAADEREPARERRRCCCATSSCPDFRDYAVEVEAARRRRSTEATRVLGAFLRDVIVREPGDNFRLFGPDETASNRLGDVFEVTDRAWDAEVAADGRAPRARRPRDGGAVRAPLPGLARGLPADRPARPLQLLRGVHPHRRLDVQPAREVAEGDARRSRGGGRSPRSTTCSRSHVWRQDHNGFSHQDPGFIDHVVNKKAEIIRVYLPPDANTLLSVADHCLRSRHYVNVIVAGKQPALELPRRWTTRSSTARAASASGSGPRTTSGGEPDVVLGCCGDVPTLETLAAAAILRERLPELKRPRRERRRPDAPAAGHASTRTACPTREFDALFTTDRPVVFAYHGYPWLIHRLTYRRTNHANLHVRGYKEEGTTTTPFDMVMLNDLDRFHLVMDVIDRVPGLAGTAAHLRQEMVDSAARGARVHARARRGRAGDPRLDLARLSGAWARSSSSTPARPA